MAGTTELAAARRLSGAAGSTLGAEFNCAAAAGMGFELAVEPPAGMAFGSVGAFATGVGGAGVSTRAKPIGRNSAPATSTVTQPTHPRRALRGSGRSNNRRTRASSRLPDSRTPRKAMGIRGGTAQ